MIGTGAVQQEKALDVWPPKKQIVWTSFLSPQLYGGVDGFGLTGAWLTESLNTNQHTFEVAPVFIVAERAALKWCMNKFGYDPASGDGIFAPGGSFSNM